MLPKAKELKIDFEAVGQRMLDRKKQLQRDGIPSDAEHSMVSKSNGSGDSPAKAAREHKPSKARKTPAKVSASRERKTGSHASR
jgi:hypothetical protein